MLGKMVPYGQIPFFWTRHYNKALQFVGNNTGYTQVLIVGDLSKNSFIAYYINDSD